MLHHFNIIKIFYINFFFSNLYYGIKKIFNILIKKILIKNEIYVLYNSFTYLISYLLLKLENFYVSP